MTYDLTLERLIDARPEVVFDTIVDPKALPEIFADQVPGWELWEWEIGVPGWLVAIERAATARVARRSSRGTDPIEGDS